MRPLCGQETRRSPGQAWGRGRWRLSLPLFVLRDGLLAGFPPMPSVALSQGPVWGGSSAREDYGVLEPVQPSSRFSGTGSRRRSEQEWLPLKISRK